MGVSDAALGFHLVVIVQMSKDRAEKLLPKRIPAFAEMAVIVLDPASVPPPSEEAPKTSGLRAALRLLMEHTPAASSTAPPPATDTGGGDDAVINSEEFEWL